MTTKNCSERFGGFAICWQNVKGTKLQGTCPPLAPINKTVHLRDLTRAHFTRPQPRLPIPPIITNAFKSTDPKRPAARRAYK